ncbi:aspartate carbamoyltransferase regulatory subunit [Zhenpiania hominis]|jgi:aspartate carbamoyltransferase regulatory subunit|uniref:Aspartate carbamoyltransferase regulatory subunit n=1 Tax=Zhenpiania hominis TaxID=2763644 RepID=A0A923SQA0_9FIRM|nr:aspartate carbamoyltransferase regulatory subunit [Zhenpiania hominis]MBC6679391.1 aspartate carbamoyltransferase regulatory subunit [Zhenpiania hominis]
MNIDGVNTGIVLDHIKAGKSMEIYNYLRLDKLDCSVAVVQNVRSSKYGKKDIIKIDDEIELDFEMLGYIDSNITINRVKDGKLQKKEHLELPETLTDVIKCKNPRCITSTEQEITHIFKLADREKKIYRCAYCDVEHKEYK